MGAKRSPELRTSERLLSAGANPQAAVLLSTASRRSEWEEPKRRHGQLLPMSNRSRREGGHPGPTTYAISLPTSRCAR
jgi:hypothetical protein